MSKPVIKTHHATKQLEYVPTAVIIGKIGVGKTTLVNMLCGTSHEARQGRDSVTRNLFLNTSNHGDEPFLLIDTPGVDSRTESYKHAVLLREGLTAKKVNTIFVVAKYDSRWDRIEDDYKYVLEMVYRYESKIVVMISHWEHCDEPDKAFPEICKMFEDCANVICYSKKSSKDKLANLMVSCISQMSPERLEVPDEDFFLRFNVTELMGKMKEAVKQYRMDVLKLKRDFTELVKQGAELPSEDQDDFLSMLNVEFNRELEALKVNFEKTHGLTMIDLNEYTIHIKITKINLDFADDFSSFVATKMNYNVNDRNDPRNLIKECPYCGLVWLRTEGCDGETTCGNVPTKQNDEHELFRSWSSFFKYSLEKINDVISFKKNDVRPRYTPNTFLAGLVRITNRSSDDDTHHVGCGRKIVFRELPKLDDNIILELFKVKTIDEAKELIKKERFQALRVQQDSAIDRKFYS